MAQTVKIHGQRDVERALEKVAAGAEEFEAGHTAVARILLPGVVQRSPRRTGALSMSWSAGAQPGAAQLTSSVDYAAPVEYGVPGRTPAARMVADTLAANESEIVATYERELTKIGERAGFDTK